MSEEELEARHLINVLEDKKFTAQGEALRTYIEELNKNIDKLQKENEELKEEIEIHKETENDLEHEILRDEEEIEHKQKTIDKIIKELEEFYEKYDVISKDKIRTKIKELENKRNYIHSMYAINVLEELLGE